MEYQPPTKGEPNALVEGYQAIPRYGPAIFVTNRHYLDSYRSHHGTWLRLTEPARELAVQLESLHLDTDDLVIIDQIGCGDLMIDEQHDVDELLKLLAARGQA